ncbi:MAG: hypothetical protein KC501_36980 [Myxococcales bacterium]|nr:hypothetical protein [Myxococcales bacterium]
MTSLQNAQKLAHSVEVLDQVANRVRRRAVEALRDGTIDFGDYEEVDDLCDQVNAAARRLDVKVLGLSLDGLDEPLAQIEQATARLDAARRKIEKVDRVVKIAGRLVVAGLAVSALALDPSRISAIAAAKALMDVATTIDAAIGAD